MYLIGLDIGTTGCKAALFGSDGHLYTSASREYSVDIPHPGWVCQNAEHVWQLAKECLGSVVKDSGIRTIAAIGLSVQGEAITAVNSKGEMIYPTILGMDTRTGEQNYWLREHFGDDYLFQHTGMPIHTINTLPKHLWLKQNEPEIWQKAAHFLLYEDFLIHKMTGEKAISACLASRTQLFDIILGDWSAEILDQIGLERDKLSPILLSGSPVREMHTSLAEEIGFSGCPLVVTGGHDQACGALGVGLTKPGLAMVSTGTAEVVEIVLPSPLLSKPLQEGNFSIYKHTIPDLYLVMSLNHSGGMVLRWLRDAFCQEEKRQAALLGLDAYEFILNELDSDPSSLLFLPHLGGSGTPYFDTNSKGAILGLSFSTTKKDLAKAILEGLTYELRLNLEIMESGGVIIDKLRAIGGGARSDYWLQLKADIIGLPIEKPQITEAASWGAALLAGHGVGCSTDFGQASEAGLNIVNTFFPDPERHKKYSAQYHIYKQIYPLNKKIFDQM